MPGLFPGLIRDRRGNISGPMAHKEILVGIITFPGFSSKVSVTDLLFLYGRGLESKRLVARFIDGFSHCVINVVANQIH